MRILCALFRCLRLCLCSIVAGLPFLSLGAEKHDNVVLQYHFLGATQLSTNSSAAAAKAVFAEKSTLLFQIMVVNRLASNLLVTLHLPVSATNFNLIRPLLHDALRAESMASLGGAPGGPINSVFAFHLDSGRARLWQKNLKALKPAGGEELRSETFSGWQWNKGARDSIWMVPARDWLLVGRGEDLAPVRSEYLQQIQKTGRPGPAMDFNCFEANVDWPGLTSWFSLASCPFKLARTKVEISAQKGDFYMVAHVIYPQAIDWQAPTMIFPTNLVREPMLSFATGQNVEPFLKSDETLSRLCTNPLRDQFYFWSMSELAFESYAAWPAQDPSNTMMTLSAQAIDELNPKLQALDGTELDWMPNKLQLVWEKLQMIGPFVQPAPADDGPFLVASLFPLSKGRGPAPRSLWTQFESRTDLVYYDWELTGPRVKHLLTVTQIVPLLQMLHVGPNEPYKVVTAPAKPGSKTPGPAEVDPHLTVEELWLANLAPILGRTATEVTRTNPTELTVVRNSPFVFSSLELILLSHWLSDTPVGPLDWSLLPQAKVSGPGVLPH
jgi:hypothetical protein